MIPIIFREMVPTDFGFVLDSFLNGAKYPTYSAMASPVYYKRNKPILINLINKSKVLIACPPDQPDTIVAFIVYSTFEIFPVIHWVHTRKMFQKQGIAKTLIEVAIPTFTKSLTIASHLINPGTGSCKFTKTFHHTKQQYNLQYDPFIIQGT